VPACNDRSNIAPTIVQNALAQPMRIIPSFGNPTKTERTPAILLLCEVSVCSYYLHFLIAEVKGIYAGLVMVEAKCIEVDNK
jgi:hypothetical protein